MSEPSAETHVFIGTFRPPFSKFRQMFRDAESKLPPSVYGRLVDIKVEDVSLCFSSLTDLNNFWQQGNFDTPVYATRDEIIAAIAKEKAAQEAMK